MPDIYHLDFETYSEVDLAELGAYRYAADPSTRVLMHAITKNDGAIHVLPHPAPGLYHTPANLDEAAALRLMKEMEDDESALIYAHNSQFESAICQYTLGMNITPERWRCTAAMCRRAAIPFSLAGASEFLGLKVTKDKIGRRLIQLFSIPPAEGKKPFGPGDTFTADGKKYTYEQGWDMFKEYCRKDVEVERELHKALHGFELTGFALEGFQFDIRMNNRGVPVNIAALKHAQAFIDEYTRDLSNEFTLITGLTPSQNIACIKWFGDRGYPYNSLAADCVEEVLGDESVYMTFDPPVLRALEIKSLLSFSAIKKIPTMIASACPDDDRVRGAFLWSGAIRTHRWSGRIIQPQNFKRPTIKRTDLAYDLISTGHGPDCIASLWDSPFEALSSCIRHFIQEPGHELLDGDFAQIEARITPWLCGDEMLDEFRRGEDVYKTMASAIFDVPYNDIDKHQRFVGKEATLAAQFGVGWRKFQAMCALKKRDLSDEVCKKAIFKYRKKRAKIVETWRLYQDAAVNAILNPGKTFTVHGKVSFMYGAFGGFAALGVRLPSGHMLIYPEARLERVTVKAEVIKEDELTGDLYTDHVEFESHQIKFYGQIPMKTTWGTCSTHGSKILENVTQAVGGDFMTHGLLSAEAEGYQIFATIHDQALAIYEPAKLQSAEGFRNALCKIPRWAPDFPLDAAVGITKYYTKED